MVRAIKGAKDAEGSPRGALMPGSSVPLVESGRAMGAARLSPFPFARPLRFTPGLVLSPPTRPHCEG